MHALDAIILYPLPKVTYIESSLMWPDHFVLGREKQGKSGLATFYLPTLNNNFPNSSLL